MDPASTTSSYQAIEANSRLAKKIIAADGGKDQFVRLLCSDDFVVDPTVRLISEMIKRGVGGALGNDYARAFVMSQTPGFIEKASSLDYLRTYAVHYFTGHPGRLKMMEIFERSLSNREFQRDLASAVSEFNNGRERGGVYYQAEKLLRIPLTIFRQTENGMEYKFPEVSCEERASKKA